MYDVVFITRPIRNTKTGKVKKWIVDAYAHNRRIDNWYEAKTLKACKKAIASRKDL